MTFRSRLRCPGRCRSWLPLLVLYPLLWALWSPAAAVPGNIHQVVAPGSGLKPRNLYFTHIGPREGLSQNSINDIVQDPRGFIWLGTQEGLNRYDGYEIKVFQKDPEDPHSISHDWIWSMHVERDGTLWIGTNGGGLNRYDPDTGRFEHFRHREGDPNSLANDRVRVVLKSRKGHLWLGTEDGGLDRFDPVTRKFEHFPHRPGDTGSLPGNLVFALLEDRDGVLWVGTDRGLARYDEEQGRFRIYRHDPEDPTSLSNDKVRSLYEDREGRLWVGTFNGLNIMDREKGTFRRYMADPDDPGSLGHYWIKDILQDRQGTLWFATDNGLDEYRPREDGFVHYRHDALRPSSLSDNRLTTLFQDAGGVLWVGSLMGLNKWNYVSDVFHEVILDPEGGASTDVITSLSEGGDGALFAGLYGEGVKRVDLATGEVTQFRHEPDNEHSLSEGRVMSLLAERDGRLWVGTRAGGLNLLDPETGEVTRYLHDPQRGDSLSSNAVAAIFRDRQGRLWVGTFGGGLNLMLSGEEGGRFASFRHEAGNPHSLSNDRVTVIYQDRADNLWIGTDGGGLNRFDPETGRFQAFRHEVSTGRGLSSDSVLHIMEAQDGALWISTLDGGLDRWSLEDRRAGLPVFRHYQRRHGLRSNAVFAALEDSHGRIWFSSNRGITRLDPATGDIRHYDRFNGLREDEFNSGAYLKSREGKLYFGSSGYLLEFDPDAILTNAHPPEVVLKLFVGNRKVGSSSSAAPGKAKPIRLGYRDNRIQFRFAGLDFASPHMNRYRYRLEGFDEQWIEPQRSRTATYTNLPPGDYVFRVLASNNDGVWNGTGASLAFQVAPPPWRSNLAYLAYFFLAAVLLLGYLRRQERKERAAAAYRAELEREVEKRTAELNQRNEQLKSLNEKLERMSVTDSLTGLMNRRYLQRNMPSRVAAIRRRIMDMREQAGDATLVDIAPSLFFMMIDLDGFKSINDAFGHAAGDQALLQVRDVLESSCRKSDTIVRWGGDEFLIVGENTGVQATERLAERVRVNLAETSYELGEGHVGRLSGSIGFAMYPFSPKGELDLLTWEQVVTLADHAAYTAKKNGRNAWVGVTGTNRSNWADINRSGQINLVALARRGVISLRTSLKELRETVKQENGNIG